MPAARVSGITMAATVQPEENETLKLADFSQQNVDNSATRKITLTPNPLRKHERNQPQISLAIVTVVIIFTARA